MDSSHQDTPLNVEHYWELICHRRWWLLVVFLVGWTIVVGASFFLPAKYRSETVILVEGQKVPERYVESNVALDQRLQNITQQILSRTRLSQIASDYHLYAAEGKTDSDSLIERMRKDIQIELVKANENQLTAFKVSYSAPTPRLAQTITGALTALFIEDNLHNRQQLSENTTAFLESQLQSARADLSQQEQRLREFKGKYLGELPEQLQSNVQILSGLQSRTQAATEALNQAEQQRLYLDSLLGQYRGSAFADGSASNPSLPALDQQLEKLKNELSYLNGRYTPQHPDILRLKEQIAATEKLKENIERAARSAKKADPSSGADTPAQTQANSPMLQIEGQIRANQLNIANRRHEIKELETQIRQYEARLNFTPVREQELAAVTRDYQQSRANYESLLAKKQQSEMATSLEKRQQGEQFQILDPPSLPLKPYSPNRFKMSLAGIAAGLGLALGLVILFEFSGSRIYGEDDLRVLTAAPVLVGIPLISMPAEARKQTRRHWLEAGAASLVLACVPLVTLLAYLKG